MRIKPTVLSWTLMVLLFGAGRCLLAGDLHLSLPKRSRLTPVQSLNRDGVNELKHGHVEKAKRLLVRAYLLDPDDPFTLNNLGYVSELEGDADRALKYYDLAAHVNTDAVIDLASNPGLKGQPVSDAFPAEHASALKSNRANVQAIVLLQKGRVAEAESILKAALLSDPRNPFLLDSMGYVMESEGDLQGALRYYSSAASLNSDERVLLTPRIKWRGQSISEVAGKSAKAVNETIAKGEDTNSQIARLNLRGVSALNHNDPQSAQKFFSQAYKLDPGNAFTLNNIGYVAELKGDRESAQMYYEAAGSAAQAGERVTYATRREAEGRRVGALAVGNQEDVESALNAIRDVKRHTRKPIELKRRDETSVPENAPRQQAPLSVQPPALPPLPLPDSNATPGNTHPLPPDVPNSPPQDSPPQ